MFRFLQRFSEWPVSTRLVFAVVATGGVFRLAGFFFAGMAAPWAGLVAAISAAIAG